MTTAPAAIVRRAKTDRIGTMLKRQTNDPYIIKAGGEGPGDIPVEPTPIPNVGQYNTPGYLPTNPGPADPVVTATSGPQINPADYWTRIDPNMGYVQPTLQVNPGQGSGRGDTGVYAGPTASGSLNAAGPFPGGNMGGRQGSIYATNPVTGNPIYNVTGSPRPGFFDSRTGKFVQGVGSTALNMFLPGAGFVASKVLDAARRANERRNTGTDLSSRYKPGGSTTGGGQTGPSGPAWYQPGYKPSPGIQAAIDRGTYSQAYGPTGNSLMSARIAASQAYGGNPNNTRAFASEGRFLMDDEGTPRMQGAMYGQQVGPAFQRPQGGPASYGTQASQDAINAWLQSQPAYQKFMNRSRPAVTAPPATVPAESAIEQMLRNNRARFGG